MSEIESINKPAVAVVMCGGGGVRLWPASRDSLPKPFVNLPLPSLDVGGGSKTDNLLARCYGQIEQLQAQLASTTVARMTVCNQAHMFLCQKQMAQRPCAGNDLLIGEPVGRNTAAAICLAAFHAIEQFGEEVVLGVLPADQLVIDANTFCQALGKAFITASSKEAPIVTLGVTPTYPAIAYGYIRKGQMTNPGVYAVDAFVEKPFKSLASDYIASGNYLWNAGIFVMQAKSALHNIQTYAPEIYAKVKHAHQGASRENNSLQPKHEDFIQVPAISFDYAVMEKCQGAQVVPSGEIGWSDVGAWHSLHENLPATDDRQNRVHAIALLQDSDNNFVLGADRLIALLGVKDLCVIDSKDALFICDQHKSEQVKQLHQHLQQSDFAHLTKYGAATLRPWGSFETLYEQPGFKVKRIDVSPSGCLSLQSHEHRSEHWTVVAGEIEVTCEDQVFTLTKDKSCYIPLGAKHRMRNRTEATASIVEVQVGSVLSEDDIIRYEDIYGRS